MANVFRNEEQRLHWNEYNRNYSRKRYRTITIKIDRKEYEKEIAYLENSPLGISGELKKLLKEKVSGGE